MAEQSNDDLKLRIEQLERLVSGLMVAVVHMTPHDKRQGLSWSFDRVIDRTSEFGREWEARARANGLTPFA